MLPVVISNCLNLQPGPSYSEFEFENSPFPSFIVDILLIIKPSGRNLFLWMLFCSPVCFIPSAELVRVFFGPDYKRGLKKHSLNALAADK